MGGNLPPGCTDADVDAAWNAEGPEPDWCPDCDGEGCVLGAFTDEIVDCRACDGSGLMPEPAQAETNGKEKGKE